MIAARRPDIHRAPGGDIEPCGQPATRRFEAVLGRLRAPRVPGPGSDTRLVAFVPCPRPRSPIRCASSFAFSKEVAHCPSKRFVLPPAPDNGEECASPSTSSSSSSSSRGCREYCPEGGSPHSRRSSRLQTESSPGQRSSSPEPPLFLWWVSASARIAPPVPSAPHSNLRHSRAEPAGRRIFASFRSLFGVKWRCIVLRTASGRCVGWGWGVLSQTVAFTKLGSEAQRWLS